MIEMYLLEQLESYARLGTLSAAAEELHLTQPSITRSMQKIESELGVTLFDRTKNKISLNENGKVAAEYARKILDSHNEMISVLQALDRNLSELSVGLVAPGPLIVLDSRIKPTFKDLQLKYELKTEDSLMEGLEKNLYHFIILDHEVTTRDYSCFKLCSERLYASLPKDHHYAGKRRLFFRELNGDSFLMVDEVGIWADIVKENMPDSRLIIQHGLENLEALIEASNIPGFATDITLESYRASSEREYAGSDRVAVPFADDNAELNFYLVYNKKQKEKLASILKIL